MILFRRIAVAAVTVTVALAHVSSGRAQTPDSPFIVKIPDVAGPIAVTPVSHSFASAGLAQTPIDLTADDYVEEEYFVSGGGNVYDWETDGGLTVRIPDLPYTTRILVRRPADPSVFSGTVLVDVANQGAGFDTYAVWGQTHDYILSEKHIWVGLTVFSRNIGALRMFDLRRYDRLAYPAPEEVCGNPRRDTWNRPAQFFPPSEDGIRWDVISQTGALLKSDGSSNPLAGFDVERVYAGMQSGGDLPTYVNAVHRNVRLAGGFTVYDGFLIKDSGGPRTLNACAEALPEGDPRRIIRNAGVPVIQILSQGSISPAIRREPGDSPGDRFRQYEIPGTSHFDASQYRYYPPVEDLAAMDVPPISAQWIFPAECEPFGLINEFPQPYLFAGAFANLERWVREGTPPPRANVIELADGEYVNDEFGNARGGVRTPWLDVPTGTFYPKREGGSTPFRCADNGYWVDFDWSRLEAIYGSYDEYRGRFLAALDRLIEDRWITARDGEKIRAEFGEPGASEGERRSSVRD